MSSQQEASLPPPPPNILSAILASASAHPQNIPASIKSLTHPTLSYLLFPHKLLIILPTPSIPPKKVIKVDIDDEIWAFDGETYYRFQLYFADEIEREEEEIGEVDDARRFYVSTEYEVEPPGMFGDWEEAVVFWFEKKGGVEEGLEMEGFQMEDNGEEPEKQLENDLTATKMGYLGNVEDDDTEEKIPENGVMGDTEPQLQNQACEETNSNTPAEETDQQFHDRIMKEETELLLAQKAASKKGSRKKKA